MTDKRMTQVSKYLSRILRHAPEAVGLTLEPGGWVEITALLRGATASGFAFTLEELEHVVAISDKQRFAIDSTGTRIRANQGHSTVVELQFEAGAPPPLLYHGTPTRNLSSILENGLSKMARHHVHLSIDTETAARVGQRSGTAVILVIDAAKMRADGFRFFRSANGVWLVDAVPSVYLREV